MHGFQNNLAQIFSLMSRCVMPNIHSGRSKVKVALEGQMIRLSKAELVQGITSLLMHVFQNNVAFICSS